MEALAYAHSYEAYEREVGIEVNFSERLWNWRGVPSAFGLHLLAIAAFVFVVCPPDLARASLESPGSAEETTLPLSAQSSSEEPPRAAELREELRQLSQQKTDFLAEGTNAAAAAAELAKTAKTQAEWQDVAKFWQQAIAALEAVPQGDPDYALARAKVSEYRANLETARQQPPSPKLPERAKSNQQSPALPTTETDISTPQAAADLRDETDSSPPQAAADLQDETDISTPQPPDFFYEGTNAAAAAAELAKTAETQAEWQDVAKFWQQALVAMESVQKGDRDYALAQEKISEYRTNLATARREPANKKPPKPAKVRQQRPAPAPVQSSPRAPEKPPERQQLTQPPAAPTAPQPPDFFYEGTNAAAAAAELAKTAETQAEWQDVAKFWQQAIAAMESVQKGDRDYGLAQEKINEYRTNLATARREPASKKPPEPAKVRQQRPAPAPVQSPPRAPEKPPERQQLTQPPSPDRPAAETVKSPPQPSAETGKETVESARQLPDFFDEGMNAAAAAAELAKTAKTKAEWQDVAKFWQQAIAAMELVPEGNGNYAPARQKITAYRANLETARQQSASAKLPERTESSQQPPSPAPVQSPAPPADFFYEGTNAAAEAAELAKTAKTQAEWQKVAGLWERAIAAMESVPEGDRDYALAREKIGEYRVNLATARQQPSSRTRSQPTASPRPGNSPEESAVKPKQDFFYEGANAAAEAAERAKTAKTAAEWDKVKQAWQKAIAAMKSVPKRDRDYALAREKLTEYEAALKYARRMPDDFSKGIAAATEAVELGKKAKTQSEWQTVAQSWQRAIAAMKAVTPDNPQFAIASQKIIEYEYYLDSIKEKLQSAISPMTFKTSIRGNLSPKSIVYSGRGRFFVQNMMYGHTIAVYNQQYELVRTLSDSVKLSDYGYKDYSGTYRGSPVEAAFSHGGQYAWVSNYQMYGSGFGNPGDDRCSPEAKHDRSFLYRINTDTLNIEKAIEVGSVPKYVAASPDNRYILASNWCSWDLSIVDPEKNREIRRVPLGAYPRGIAIDSNSLRAYVAVMGSRDIAIVNLQNFAVDWIKNVGTGPRHLNISPDNRYLYASLNSEGTVAKIDLTNNEWQKVRTGNAPRSTVLSADGQFLYVVNYFSNTVSKVRTSDLKVLQSLPTEAHPIGITYDPDTKQVWVVCYSGSIMVFQD